MLEPHISCTLILLYIFAPISEKQCVLVYDGELSRDQSMPTSFICDTYTLRRMIVNTVLLYQDYSLEQGGIVQYFLLIC